MLVLLYSLLYIWQAVSKPTSRNSELVIYVSMINRIELFWSRGRRFFPRGTLRFCHHPWFTTSENMKYSWKKITFENILTTNFNQVIYRRYTQTGFVYWIEQAIYQNLYLFILLIMTGQQIFRCIKCFGTFDLFSEPLATINFSVNILRRHTFWAKINFIY